LPQHPPKTNKCTKTEGRGKKKKRAIKERGGLQIPKKKKKKRNKLGNKRAI